MTPEHRGTGPRTLRHLVLARPPTMPVSTLPSAEHLDPINVPERRWYSHADDGDGQRSCNPCGKRPKDTVIQRHHLVVCSLEQWGVVQRRIQLLLIELLRMDPLLSVLYVNPPVDPLHELSQRRLPSRTRPLLEQVEEAVWLLNPVKLLPRAVGPMADEMLVREVRRSAKRLGFDRPVLWINDALYADLVPATGWSSVYDVTDDWLHSSITNRTLRTLRSRDAALVARCDAVVVCSPDLAASRGRDRPVHLIPNGVDTERFRTPRPRPSDLPDAPVVLYTGSIHEDRFDVGLCVDLTRAVDPANVVLLGPNSLSATSTAHLAAMPNIRILGARPYADVPAYMQHADVLIVPHHVTPFTESLDPIKAYESVAVGKTTVATPVAGFRDLGPPVLVCERDRFVATVKDVLGNVADGGGAIEPEPQAVATWHDRAAAFAAVLDDLWQHSEP